MSTDETGFVVPPLHNLAEGERHFHVQCEYFRGQIDVKEFRKRCPQYTVLSTDPLLIEPEKGCYAVITKFGSVALWNATDQTKEELWKELQDLPDTLDGDELVRDELVVYAGRKNETVTFNDVSVRNLTVGTVKIISLGLCQSVALEHFERKVLKALRRYEPTTSKLRDEGKPSMTEREILKTVGFALDVRATVLANLTLFDDPPETWESEALARLHKLMKDHFDLEERLSAINQKVQYLTDLNQTLMNVLSTNKSHRLEWIIIILIAIEILYFVYAESK